MKRFFLFFVSLILLTGLIPMTVSATRPSSSRQYRGMDVSEWQGTIDFNRVARSGIKVVYIRSSLGNNYVDRQFEANYRKARAAGLSVGFYHYVTARSAKQAAYQADFFVNTIRGKSFDCRLAMDFENLGGLTEGKFEESAQAFLRLLKKAAGKGVCFTVIYLMRRGPSRAALQDTLCGLPSMEWQDPRTPTGRNGSAGSILTKDELRE